MQYMVVPLLVLDKDCLLQKQLLSFHYYCCYSQHQVLHQGTTPFAIRY